MTLRKRFYVLIVALFVVFAWLSTWCYAADCGFGSGCPNSVPPCYKVTITGHIACPYCENGPLADGIYVSKYQGNCTWAGDKVNGYTMELYNLEADANTTDLHFPFEHYCKNPNCGASWDCQDAFTNANGVGDCNNDVVEDDCCTEGLSFSYGGTAHWEPVWDCAACNHCGTLDITVTIGNNPVHYANLNCCPPGNKGEYSNVIMSCPAADYVIPDYKIERWNPKAEEWVEDKKSKLVTVTPEPNECDDVHSVNFGIKAGQGQSPAKARVICTAAFLTETGDSNSTTAIVYVEPHKGECCVDPTGGGGDGNYGGGCNGGVCILPAPGFAPGPPFDDVSAGNGLILPFAGTNPVDEFSSATVFDYGNGEVDIAVKLPGYTQSYILNRPLAFMPGWSASIDDNDDVTVESPDGLKYVYYEDCNHVLTEIKDFSDANIVVFDYNKTTDRIDKQSDANDPNLHIEYQYDSNGLLETLIAHDYNESREYTITYDSNNRAIAFSGCESCGGYGAFQYEYDANDLLTKVKDANDPDVIIYEYKYNSNDWVTDIYFGEANDANHIRKFVYTDSNDGGYIVDIYDYIDSDTYRVTREYRNSAGFVTKRIMYENLDEDPADPVGKSFIEHIVYYYDANDVVTKKVVIPPLGDSNDPDPNSGIRKEYTYDPNTSRMQTERWFGDINDANFTVISYTYEFTPDGNNVRVKSSTDARDANTVYSYDGNDVVPKFKTMPKVTNGVSGMLQLRYGYEYDSRKRTTLEKQLDHLDSDKLLVQTKYVYDDYGNLVYRYDDYGDSNEITEYRYNGFNEMIRMILPSGVVSGSSYNSNGKLESEFVLANPADVNESEPNLISQTKYSYDNNGRIKKIARAKHDGEFVFNSPGSWIWTEYEYDLRGNRTKVIEDVNGLGLETTYEYNNQGEVIKVTLPNGKWTETLRDGRGLVAYTVVGYGDTTVATTAFYYDDNGNLEEQIAPNVIKTKYQYDDFDRLIKVTKGL